MSRTRRWGIIRNSAMALVLVATSAAALPEEVKIANIEHPSRLYGEGGVVVTVESAKKKVECVAYRDGVPVGSGSGYTTARIANVTVLMTERKGKLTIKCM